MNKKYIICIGAAKSGTTWLNSIFESSINIGSSSIGETDYFTYNFDKPFDWYRSLFGTNFDVFFDCSPSYAFYDQTPARMISKLGRDNVKIIYLIRNPIERIYSHYKMHYRGGRFKEVLSDLIDRYPRYLGDSMYYSNYRKYEDAFGSSNVGVFLFDDLKANPKKLLMEIENFVGLRIKGYDHKLLGTKIHKDKGVPKYNILYRYGVYMYRSIRRNPKLSFAHYLADWFRKVTSSGVREPMTYPTMDQDLKQQTFIQLEGEIQGIGKVIGVDLVKLWRL